MSEILEKVSYDEIKFFLDPWLRIKIELWRIAK